VGEEAAVNSKEVKASPPREPTRRRRKTSLKSTTASAANSATANAAAIIAAAAAAREPPGDPRSFVCTAVETVSKPAQIRASLVALLATKPAALGFRVTMTDRLVLLHLASPTGVLQISTKPGRNPHKQLLGILSSTDILLVPVGKSPRHEPHVHSQTQHIDTAT
jgi:hypothetical protein